MWRNSIDKTQLHPGLVRVIDLALEKLESNGTPYKVYSGLRTFKEQDELYAKGRTVPGKVITKAKGGQSMHNYGLAVDLAPLDTSTEVDWDVFWPDPDMENSVWFELEEALFDAAIEVDQDQNDLVDYEWGGRWKFRDVPHCQVRITLRELQTGYYPPCGNLAWLIKSHTTFLWGTWWTKKRVQYLLNSLDHDVGPVDGLIGKRTEGAIADFYNSRDMEVSYPLYNKRLMESLLRLAPRRPVEDP